MGVNPDDKYHKILRAAIEVISAKGLERTSISDIVKKAGIAQGTFYLYFPSKNALIPAMAENLLNKLLAEMKYQTSNLDQFWDILTLLIDITFQITEEYKDVLVLCYSGMAFDNSLEKWEKIYEPYYQWFEEKMSKGIENGEIISDLNVKRSVRMIVNLIENSAEQLYIGHVQESTEELKRDLTQFIQRALT